MNSKNQIFKVIFYNQDEIFEVFAKHIYQSDMYGFIEIEEYIFGERAQVVVDPSEEKLKQTFEGVKRSYIPMHNIVRIDEVDACGQVKISENKGGNVTFMNQVPPKAT